MKFNALIAASIIGFATFAAAGDNPDPRPSPNKGGNPDPVSVLGHDKKHFEGGHPVDSLKWNEHHQHHEHKRDDHHDHKGEHHHEHEGEDHHEHEHEHEHGQGASGRVKRWLRGNPNNRYQSWGMWNDFKRDVPAPPAEEAEKAENPNDEVEYIYIEGEKEEHEEETKNMKRSAPFPPLNNTKPENKTRFGEAMKSAVLEGVEEGNLDNMPHPPEKPAPFPPSSQHPEPGPGPGPQPQQPGLAKRWLRGNPNNRYQSWGMWNDFKKREAEAEANPEPMPEPKPMPQPEPEPGTPALQMGHLSNYKLKDHLNVHGLDQQKGTFGLTHKKDGDTPAKAPAYSPVPFPPEHYGGEKSGAEGHTLGG